MKLAGKEWKHIAPAEHDGLPSWTLDVLVGVQLVITPLKGEPWFQVCVGERFYYGLARLTARGMPEAFKEAELRGAQFFRDLGEAVDEAVIAIELGSAQDTDITQPVRMRKPFLLRGAVEVGSNEEHEFLVELSRTTKYSGEELSRALKTLQKAFPEQTRHCQQLLRDAVHLAHVNDWDLLSTVDRHVKGML